MPYIQTTAYLSSIQGFKNRQALVLFLSLYIFLPVSYQLGKMVAVGGKSGSSLVTGVEAAEPDPAGGSGCT